MHQIQIDNISMPQVLETGDYLATGPFYHMNRTADFNVLIYVKNGAIYVTEDEIDYEILPGQLLFLKAGINHYGKIEIPKGTRWYFVHFKTLQCQVQDFLNTNSKTISGAFGTNTLQNFDGLLPKKTEKLLDTDLEKDLGQLVENFHSDNAEILWQINADFFKLLTKLILFSKGNYRKPGLAQKICNFLDSHLEWNFEAARLEKEFNLSYKRLAAVFKKEKQQSMQQYHTKARIRQACKLLRTTELYIGEISDRLGFEDQLYFSRVFKQVKGINPREYRKQLSY